MARDSRDPKGYYALLNLSPNASDAEVRLAYTFLKIAWGRNRKLNRAKIKARSNRSWPDAKGQEVQDA